MTFRYATAVIAIAAASLSGAAFAFLVDSTEPPQAARWRLDLELDFEALDPQAVQFAIFEHDPRPGFLRGLSRNEGLYREMVLTCEADDPEQAMRHVSQNVAWNRAFRDVTGDEVYLLSKVAGPSTINSNAIAGRKWIVSKVAVSNERPVCWCVPVDVAAGEAKRVVLSATNTYDLDAAFAEAIGD